MAIPNISTELSRLSGSLSRLKAHAEWLALKESERRAGDPPALVMDRALAKDIRLETGRFMSMAAGLHEALNQHAGPKGAADDSVRGKGAARRHAAHNMVERNSTGRRGTAQNAAGRNRRDRRKPDTWRDEILRLERDFQSLRLPKDL